MNSLDTIKKQIDNAQNGDLENQINSIADAYKQLDKQLENNWIGCNLFDVGLLLLLLLLLSLFIL